MRRPRVATSSEEANVVYPVVEGLTRRHAEVEGDHLLGVERNSEAEALLGQLAERNGVRLPLRGERYVDAVVVPARGVCRSDETRSSRGVSLHRGGPHFEAQEPGAFGGKGDPLERA